jgi:hypothetical protein
MSVVSLIYRDAMLSLMLLNPRIRLIKQKKKKKNPRIRKILFMWAESFRAYSKKKKKIETFCWSLGGRNQSS